ncbi:MAG: DUF721 domain-containing protein [Deinococcota bacterium]|jgi:predicted nucleic acid-binding Zn ribbon protein|nr:DUF721 domain-containing protein [Deinococcota bacterium]
MTKPARVNDLLGEVFARSGMKRGVRRAEAVLLWPHAAGPEVAKFSRATGLSDGILFVEVSDSETAMHLSLQRQRFLDVYRAKFHLKDVREIRFRVGRRRDEAADASLAGARDGNTAEIPPDPRALAILAKSLTDLNLPEALEQPAMRAAKAMLAYRARKEAEGFKPCPVCDGLTPQGQMCETCSRYAGQVKVKRAAYRLAVRPDEATPLLSLEERQVAVHHAKGYLKDKLQELLPQVLAEPAIKPYLLAAARCYLAHHLGKRLEDIKEDDLDRLDSRIARVLGRW